MFLRRDPAHLPTAAEALPGRPKRPFAVPERHFVLGTPLEPPFPDGLEQVVFGMGSPRPRNAARSFSAKDKGVDARNRLHSSRVKST